MVVNELTRALREFIAEAVKEYLLPTKNGDAKAPTVVNGYLPPKRTNRDVDDFPFIVVRADAGSTDADNSLIDVSIIIGCYSQEFDGHEYCINVMSRINKALTSMTNGTLNDRYMLQYPLVWQMVEDQPYPQWQLDMSTKWLYKASTVNFGYLDPNEKELE